MTDGGVDADPDEQGAEIRHDEVEDQRPRLVNAELLRPGHEGVDCDRREGEQHDIDEDADANPNPGEIELHSHRSGSLIREDRSGGCRSVPTCPSNVRCDFTVEPVM